MCFKKRILEENFKNYAPVLGLIGGAGLGYLSAEDYAAGVNNAWDDMSQKLSNGITDFDGKENVGEAITKLLTFRGTPGDVGAALQYKDILDQIKENPYAEDYEVSAKYLSGPQGAIIGGILGSSIGRRIAPEQQAIKKDIIK